MEDGEYLNNLALILESAETDQTRYGTDEIRFIKIEAYSAKDIAARLRGIESKIMVH